MKHGNDPFLYCSWTHPECYLPRRMEPTDTSNNLGFLKASVDVRTLYCLCPKQTITMLLPPVHAAGIRCAGCGWALGVCF